jgi:hypothetical protein
MTGAKFTDFEPAAVLLQAPPPVVVCARSKFSLATVTDHRLSLN